MCGIIGSFPFQIKTEDDLYDDRVRSVIQRALFTEALVALKPRGEDSSGVSLLWNDGKTAVIKQPVASPTFVRDDGSFGEKFKNPNSPDKNFQSFMPLWNRGVGTDFRLRQALGHVRKGTQGSPYITHNNHPIIIPPDGNLDESQPLPEGTVIGVHNGGIANDKALFTKGKFNRIGEVDSEIIFHLISQYKDDISLDNLEDTFEELEGAFAVMAYNNAIPNKVGCLREVRPMEAAFSPELGTLFIVSERKYLDAAWFIYDRWRVREADQEFCWEDENGEVDCIGKVGDVFPYATYRWYGGERTYITTSSIEAGVFVLDLDQEVSKDTKPEDLIKVNKIYKKAKTTYYGAAYGGSGRQTSTTNTTKKDTRAASTASSTSAKKEEPDISKTTVVDTTDYSRSASEDGPDEQALVEAEIETDDIEEGTVVELGMDEIQDTGEEEDDEVEESECGFSWEDRCRIGKKKLYNLGSETINEEMLISKEQPEIEECLDAYQILPSDKNKVPSLVAGMYDVIYPEGFADGFADGYEQAYLELSTLMDESEDNDSSAEIEDLKTQVKNLRFATETLVAKKRKASEILTVFGPLVRLLMRREGVLSGTSSSNFDRDKLKKLMLKAGIEDRNVSKFTKILTKKA